MGLRFNPGLALTHFGTTGPWGVGSSIAFSGYICSTFVPKSSMTAYKAGQYFRQIYQLQKQLQPEMDDEDSIIQVEDEDGNAI